MSTLLPIHVAAGALAILAGAVALMSTKGAETHRGSGRVFVYAMLVMAGTAVLISVVIEVNIGNVLQAGLAGYLVLTGMLTMRDEPRSRAIDVAAMLVVLAIAATHATLAVMASRSESGTIGGYGPPLFIVFGGIALIAGAGDARLLARRATRAPRRLARHLWRMCFALFIATGSFFLGQADEFPEALRIWPVLAALAVAPLLAMLYWLWRVRVRGNLTRIAHAGARVPPGVEPEPASTQRA